MIQIYNGSTSVQIKRWLEHIKSTNHKRTYKVWHQGCVAIDEALIVHCGANDHITRPRMPRSESRLQFGWSTDTNVLEYSKGKGRNFSSDWYWLEQRTSQRAGSIYAPLSYSITFIFQDFEVRLPVGKIIFIPAWVEYEVKKVLKKTFVVHTYVMASRIQISAYLRAINLLPDRLR